MTDTQSSDALDVLRTQNDVIADLMGRWVEQTKKLAAGDDVNTRWERGSEVKLLLEHLAVREAAKDAILQRLTDHPDLAERFEGDGVARRQAISDLDHKVRGHNAINLNYASLDEVIVRLRDLLGPELTGERDGLLDQLTGALGPASERDLPSARKVQMVSDVNPNPVLRWYDHVGPLKAVKAFYASLRSVPHGGTAPSVDSAREHTPGPRT